MEIDTTVVIMKYVNNRSPIDFRFSELLLMIPVMIEAKINGIMTICTNRRNICPGMSNQFAALWLISSDTIPFSGFISSPNKIPRTIPTITFAQSCPLINRCKCSVSWFKDCISTRTKVWWSRKNQMILISFLFSRPNDCIWNHVDRYNHWFRGRNYWINDELNLS